MSDNEEQYYQVDKTYGPYIKELAKDGDTWFTAPELHQNGRSAPELQQRPLNGRRRTRANT